MIPPGDTEAEHRCNHCHAFSCDCPQLDRLNDELEVEHVPNGLLLHMAYVGHVHFTPAEFLDFCERGAAIARKRMM